MNRRLLGNTQQHLRGMQDSILPGTTLFLFNFNRRQLLGPFRAEGTAEHNIEPGWGKRRSHQGFQPICAIGFQHTLDILFDWHTTYPPDRVEQFLDDKGKIMDEIIRRELSARGHNPEELIARNIEVYEREEARIQEKRAEYRSKMAERNASAKINN